MVDWTGTNPKDPLKKSGPEQQRELFLQFSQLAKGFQTEDVIGATLNLLVNCFRQAYATRSKAFEAYDQRAAKGKTLLAEHYDLTGKRRNVFPFHQVVEMPFFDFSPKGSKKN